MIFQKFLYTTGAEKRATVKTLTQRVLPKDTRNCKSKKSRRGNTFQYYLKKKDVGLIRQCKL